jgi:predicted RNA binding protein YcfA (HicA-like mRNA interferase family)
VTTRDVIRRLQADGWVEVRQTKHKVFSHPTKTGHVVVPVHSGKDIPIGTLAQIFKQAGWGKP